MQRRTSRRRVINSTPVRLLVVTTACVFVAEALIMMFLSVLPRMGTWMTVFFDATLIVVCVLPVLYLSLFRPLQKSAQERAESVERFKGIYSQSPVGIEIYDIDGKLIDVNQICLDMFGVESVEEVKGFRLFEDPNLPDKEKEHSEKARK